MCVMYQYICVYIYICIYIYIIKMTAKLKGLLIAEDSIATKIDALQIWIGVGALGNLLEICLEVHLVFLLIFILSKCVYWTAPV